MSSDRLKKTIYPLKQLHTFSDLYTIDYLFFHLFSIIGTLW